MKVRTPILTALGVVAAAAVVAGGALAGPVHTTKTIAFTGTYAGKATTKITDDIADITADGPGKATLLGSGKVVGKGTGDTSQQPCVPFGGTGTMSGPGGTIVFKVVTSSRGCGDEAGQVFSLSGKATIVKATKKLAKAKGTLKFTGVYNRAEGTFSVKFKGTLTQ